MIEKEQQIYERYLEIMEELLNDFNYEQEDFSQLESFNNSLHNFIVLCAIRKDKGLDAKNKNEQ